MQTMRLIMNGEPVIHKHDCLAERIGQVMTEEEIRSFSVECLIDEYEKCNVKCYHVDNPDERKLDFYFERGDRRINIIVAYGNDFDTSNIDTSFLLELHEKYGDHPRIIFADSWCFESENGAIPICGGTYCFKYHPISLIPEEEGNRFTEDELDIMNIYASAWNMRDAYLIAPYIDSSFHYTSDWVFDVLPGKTEFIEYFQGKLDAIKVSGSEVKAAVGVNDKSGKFAILLEQDGDKAIIETEIKNGKLVQARMTNDNGSYVVLNNMNESVEAKKLMSLYDFEYEIVPLLTQMYAHGEIPEAAFMDLKWIKENLIGEGFDFDFDFNEVDVAGKVLNEQYGIIVYTFPTPRRVPEAKYGAVVFNIHDNTKVSYYTLEYSCNGNWMLCSMALKEHLNFGFVEECMNINDFSQLLIERFSLYPSLWLKLRIKFKALLG